MRNATVFIPMVLITALVGCSDNKKPKGVVQNSAPIASGANFTTQADRELSGMLSASDADGDALMFVIAGEPSQGTLMLEADGNFTYLPNETVTGTDSFSFTASDGVRSSMAATVNITIEPQQVSFEAYSRQAFEQAATDNPLPINGRVFEQDVTEPDAYSDLLM